MTSEHQPRPNRQSETGRGGEKAPPDPLRALGERLDRASLQARRLAAEAAEAALRGAPTPPPSGWAAPGGDEDARSAAGELTAWWRRLHRCAIWFHRSCSARWRRRCESRCSRSGRCSTGTSSASTANRPRPARPRTYPSSEWLFGGAGPGRRSRRAAERRKGGTGPTMGSLAASVGNIGSPEDPYAPPFGKAVKRGAFFRLGGRSLAPGRLPAP